MLTPQKSHLKVLRYILIGPQLFQLMKIEKLEFNLAVDYEPSLLNEQILHQLLSEFRSYS